MGWIVRLVESGTEGPSGGVDVLEIDRPGDLGDLAALGLTHVEGKQLSSPGAAGDCRRPEPQPCRPAAAVPDCGAACRVKDYRPHRIATLFGAVTLRLPRFRCAGCRGREAGVEWPPHCRSTPEFDQIRAHLSALLPYRVAAGVLEHLFPIEAGTHHETLRGRTLKLGGELRDAAAAESGAVAATITLTADSTFIRSCEDGQRHLEVRLGNVETLAGTRQVFAAVAKTDTEIDKLIQRTLTEVGQAEDTEVTTFTDGCAGLRAMLADAGVTTPPFLDWFHIAMRLQHAKQVAGGLSTDTPEREQAKAVIVAAVERLHWRIWNGKASDARLTLDRIRDVTPAFHGEGDGQRDGRKVPPALRRLWTAVRELDRYLANQSAWLVNYAERHRAGQRVGTALTEGTANFLVNRRMNKAQQMRWSRRGADRLLQVRCTVFNGKLGSGFGQLFNAEADPTSGMALAA